MRTRSIPLLPARRRPITAGLAILLLVLPLGYWGLLPAFMQRIDDDVAFTPPQEVPAAGSQAVALAAALIEREVERYGWTANDPWFQPTWGLDNMPNYQIGIMQALYRFSLEMSDQIGRTRGSSPVDADLEAAAGKLKFPPNQWYVSLDQWLPQLPSEGHYRDARQRLLAYNRRLASGDVEAVFDRRSDNLLATLDRFAADLGSASAQLAERVETGGVMGVDLAADDLFYATKGRVYAYYLLLAALRKDFAGVIDDRDLESVYDQMLLSLERAATLDPVIVLNGAPDGMAVPNHLTAMGFQLLRARTQLREVTAILTK